MHKDLKVWAIWHLKEIVKKVERAQQIAPELGDTDILANSEFLFYKRLS